MKKEQILKYLRTLAVIIILSIVIETLIVIYNFAINKIYTKLHFIGNQTIEISKDNIEFEEDETNQIIKVKNTSNERIYNVTLQLNENNKDVYLRIIYNNQAKFMPRENENGTKFKVYFINGIDLQEFELNYPKTQIDINKVDKILINDNITYMPAIEFSFIQLGIIFIILIAIYILFKLYKLLKQKEISIRKENVFLILASIVGISFIFINVPQARYDEHAHYWKAYEISSGNIISNNSNGLPKSVIELFKRADGTYPNREFNYETIKEKIDDQLNEDDKEFFSVGASGSLTPISYIPQLVGITIGRVLSVSPLIILYLGRLTNLIAYIALIYLAIKMMPFEKWKAIIMIIALFPMSIDLAATVSPDAVIISTTILAISYAMKLKFKDEKINLKQISLLGILCMIPTVCKIVYFPICLLVFMLPKEKFENRLKKNLSWIIVLLITFIPYLVLNSIVSTGGWDIQIRTNPTEQILFTASDLVRDIGTVINTFYEKASEIFDTMVGGWNTVQILVVFIFIILVMAIFMKNGESSKYKFTKKDKILLTIMVIIESLGVVAAMYITWTQAQLNYVEGVQGRYFLPIIPLLCLLLSSDKIECNIKNKTIKYAIITVLIFSLVCGYSIRTYI